MLSISDFGFDSDDIKYDLSEYVGVVNSFSKQRKLAILNNYNSIKDYVMILYYLRFERKYSYDKIYDILFFDKPLHKNLNSNPKHNSVYKIYFELRWTFSLNFEEVLEEDIKQSKKLNKIKEDSYLFDENVFDNEPKYKELYSNALEISKSYNYSLRYTSLNYKSFKQYFNALYYFRIKCKLSTGQIQKIIRIKGYRAVVNWLKACGLEYSVKDSQENVIRNYSFSLKEGRRTIINSMYEKATFGSPIENLVRGMFSVCINDYIGATSFEIIVGINSKNIISPYEVDIPIIIIRKNTGEVYKFAVEINGEIYHTNNDREHKKHVALHSNGWKLFTIWQMQHTNNPYGSIEKQFKNICQQIAEMVISSSH